jgi:hypothetical protein
VKGGAERFFDRLGFVPTIAASCQLRATIALAIPYRSSTRSSDVTDDRGDFDVGVLERFSWTRRTCFRVRMSWIAVGGTRAQLVHGLHAPKKNRLGARHPQHVSLGDG